MEFLFCMCGCFLNFSFLRVYPDRNFSLYPHFLMDEQLPRSEALHTFSIPPFFMSHEYVIAR